MSGEVVRMDEKKAQPCRFCQSVSVKVDFDDEANPGELRLYVKCKNCGARGPWVGGLEANDRKASERAIYLWNCSWEKK